MLMEGDTSEIDTKKSEICTIQKDLMCRQTFLCGCCWNNFDSFSLCQKHILDESSCRLDEFNKPVTVNIKGSKLLCPHNQFCVFQFANLGSLQTHLRCHVIPPTTNNNFVCFKCGETFKKWRQNAIHLWKTHGIDVDLLSCNSCDSFKTLVPAKLIEHAKIHAESKVCFTCGQSFKRIERLKYHYYCNHWDKSVKWSRMKMCEICHKFFVDSKCLKKHIQFVHYRMKPFSCRICGHKTSRQDSLDLHLRRHKGDKIFACQSCDFKTTDKSSLKRHAYRHESASALPHKCPFCASRYTYTSAVKSHIASKHPGRMSDFVCNLCDFCSLNRQVLNAHVREHYDVQKSINVINNAEVAVVESLCHISDGTQHSVFDEDSLCAATTDLGGTTIPAGENVTLLQKPKIILDEK